MATGDLDFPFGNADVQSFAPAAAVTLTVKNMLTYFLASAAMAAGMTINFAIDGQIRPGARVVVRAASDGTARTVTPGTRAQGLAVAGVINGVFEYEFEYKPSTGVGTFAFVLINTRGLTSNFLIMKTLFKLFFSLISTVLVASIVASVYEVPVPDELQVMAAISLVLFAIRIVAKNPADAGRVSGLTYGVAVEFLESVIAEFIMEDYPWLRRAKDRSGNVLKGSVIHIPQAGGLPGRA